MSKPTPKPDLELNESKQTSERETLTCRISSVLRFGLAHRTCSLAGPACISHARTTYKPKRRSQLSQVMKIQRKRDHDRDL